MNNYICAILLREQTNFLIWRISVSCLIIIHGSFEQWHRVANRRAMFSRIPHWRKFPPNRNSKWWVTGNDYTTHANLTKYKYVRVISVLETDQSKNWQEKAETNMAPNRLVLSKAPERTLCFKMTFKAQSLSLAGFMGNNMLCDHHSLEDGTLRVWDEYDFGRNSLLVYVDTLPLCCRFFFLYLK